MRLNIEHITTFTYDAPIGEAHTMMRLRPMDAGGQHCLSFSLFTEPRGELTEFTDPRGNNVRYFDVLAPHEQLIVSAMSQVLTPERMTNERIELTSFERFDYLNESPYTEHSDIIHDLAHSAEVANDAYATALALMRAIHAAIKYERGVTDVKTTAPQALKLGRGVCQDYTHVMLSACRSVGLPARYVSGYFYGTKSNTAYAATHAWVDVFLEGQGWVSLDPTHNTEQTPNHVRVAIGRDYADVTPTRGIYTGHASEKLSVKVRVYPA